MSFLYQFNDRLITRKEFQWDYKITMKMKANGLTKFANAWGFMETKNTVLLTIESNRKILGHPKSFNECEAMIKQVFKSAFK